MMRFVSKIVVAVYPWTESCLDIVHVEMEIKSL